MKNRLRLGIGVVCVAGIVAGLMLLHETTPSYASLRLVREEQVPGSLGFVLEPPAGSFDPTVTPAAALRIAAGAAPPPRGVHVALASVPSALLGIAGDRDIPVWALVARKLCYFSSKGDLVSSARSSPTAQELPGCTRKNLSVVLVDARTGEALAAVRGYDLTGAWEPSTASG
jgi:hypothetical protein